MKLLAAFAALALLVPSFGSVPVPADSATVATATALAGPSAATMGSAQDASPRSVRGSAQSSSADAFTGAVPGSARGSVRDAATSSPTAWPAAASAEGNGAPVDSLSSEPVPLTHTGDGRDSVPSMPRRSDSTPGTATATGTAERPGATSDGSRTDATAGCTPRRFSDAGGPFLEHINWMSCRSLTTGYRNGTFGVGKKLSRAETAIFLYRLSGEIHRRRTAEDFTDVPVTSPAFTAISWMREKGYTQGYTDGTFGPDRSITRGELASFLYRASGDTFSPPGRSPFSDMTNNQEAFYYGPAAWLKSIRLITGYADRSFRPLRAVTRGETAKFIHAYSRMEEGESSPTTVDRWTTVAADLHATADPATKPLRSLPPQGYVARLGERGPMTRVQAGSATGWVNTDFLAAGRPGTTLKPYPSTRTWSLKAANNMAPWCWRVPITTFEGHNGYASFTATGLPGKPSTLDVTEQIALGHNWDADSVPARAVQLHECAHILQYRAYRYDSRALKSAMNRIYGTGPADGVEHMADCMADAMGAQRVSPGWIVGYGGSCTSTQLAAARKVIAGQRP